jgi:hypothetical protein
MPLPGKMRRGRRYHPVATRRRRYFRLAASEFGFKLFIRWQESSPALWVQSNTVSGARLVPSRSTGNCKSRLESFYEPKKAIGMATKKRKEHMENGIHRLVACQWFHLAGEYKPRQWEGPSSSLCDLCVLLRLNYLQNLG